jgi:phosphohistidine phosphatase
MKLYLIQHAKALSKEQDPDRPLSEEGRAELDKITAFIRPLNLSVDYLWHSGKKRAAQTAEALAQVIKIEKTQAALDNLGPSDDVAAFEKKIAPLDCNIMVVGHLPFLSKLTALLLNKDESAQTIAFRNAAVVCLDRTENNQWLLDWIVTPDIIG